MFEREFGVPYYGLDETGRIKLETLLQLLQEAACLHADSAGIGVADLLKEDATWVLRRYRVNIGNLPGKGSLILRTWFEPQRNLFSVRAFEALTPSGERIADAWSAWIVVDLKRGRPVRLDRALPNSYFVMTEPTGEPVTEEIASITGFDCERSFRVRRRELDLNGHANHTVYFDWAVESLPDEAIRGLSPVRLDAEFIFSVKKERVTVRTKRTHDDPMSFTHEIIAENGVLAARIATVWKAGSALTALG